MFNRKPGGAHAGPLSWTAKGTRLGLTAWAVFIVVAAVLAFALDIGNVKSWWRSRSAGDIAVAWFAREADGSVRLVPLDQVLTDATLEDMYADRLRVPINLAFQGLESRDLTVERVEIRYPAGLKVKPAGDPRISPDGRTHVYEHDLRKLGVDGSFVPLDTIDVVTVPYDFVLTPTVVLAKHRVPFYLLAIAGGFLGRSRDALRLEGTVHFADRKPVSFVVLMQQDSHVEVLGFPDYRLATTPTAADRRLFTQTPLSREQVTVNWERRNRESVTIGFIQSKAPGQGVIQRVTVNGRLVRMLVDRNRDETLDFELMDANRDGVPEAKGVPRSATPMPAWPPSAV